MTSPLDAKRAAEYIGVPLRSFYTLDIPRLQYGPRRVRYRVVDLDEYMMKCRCTRAESKAAGGTRESLADSGAADIRGGKLRALAVSSANRSHAIPDAPTFYEAGIADYQVSNWYGILAPAGKPNDIVALLNREIIAAVQNPEMKERFESALLEPGASSPQEFVAFLKAEAARWSQLIATVGIKAQ